MRILVVEDTDFKFEDIRDALSEHEVVHEKYKNTALKRLYDGTFDCIVLDMRFPLYEGSPIIRDAGLQVLKRMHHRGYDIPVIICSSCGCTIPEEIKNVTGHILYDGNGCLERQLKFLLEKSVQTNN